MKRRQTREGVTRDSASVRREADDSFRTSAGKTVSSRRTCPISRRHCLTSLCIDRWLLKLTCPLIRSSCRTSKTRCLRRISSPATVEKLVHGQVTIIFVVSVCLFVCLCRVFLSHLRSDLDQTRTHVTCPVLVVSPRI